MLVTTENDSTIDTIPVVVNKGKRQDEKDATFMVGFKGKEAELTDTVDRGLVENKTDFLMTREGIRRQLIGQRFGQKSVNDSGFHVASGEAMHDGYAWVHREFSIHGWDPS